MPDNTLLQVAFFLIPYMSVPRKPRLVWPFMRMAALLYTQYTLMIRGYETRPDHLQQNLQSSLIDCYMSFLNARMFIVSDKF